VACRSDLFGVVDDIVVRYANARRLVGTLPCAAVRNRVVETLPKRAFAYLWATTFRPLWVEGDAQSLDPPPCSWGRDALLTDDDLVAIETQFFGGMIERYYLDLPGVRPGT